MTDRKILLVAILAVCAGCSSGPTADPAKDQADIKALEDRFMTAFKARDVNAIMANYVPDQSLIVFDTVPPRQYTGAAAYRKDFEDFLAAFPGPFEAGMSELDITVGGDVAYGHNIQSFSLTDKDGKKLEGVMRVTDGYKKINGQWLISHEHASVPVDLVAMRPVLDSK